MRIISHPFRIKEGIVTVDHSERNNINCSAEGYPRPDFFLSYNNNPVNATVTLEISSAAETDEGKYCCNASNLLGRHNVTCLSLQVESSSSVIIPIIASIFSVLGILLVVITGVSV